MKALVTGASSGIGRDMARELSILGIDLILVAREQEKLEKLKQELKGNIQIIVMDLASIENCKSLYNQVGDIDILINNAGFGLFGEFSEIDLDKEIQMINTNVQAVHILTKLFLKGMKEKNSGHILNVSSVAGFMPGPLMATYYATKAYVLRLSQSLQQELRKENSNVKISILCPGPVETNFDNVADVKFKIPSLTSQRVAKYAIKMMLKDKKIILPGAEAKIIRILTKLSPSSFSGKVVYKLQKRKNK